MTERTNSIQTCPNTPSIYRVRGSRKYILWTLRRFIAKMASPRDHVFRTRWERWEKMWVPFDWLEPKWDLKPQTSSVQANCSIHRKLINLSNRSCRAPHILAIAESFGKDCLQALKKWRHNVLCTRLQNDMTVTWVWDSKPYQPEINFLSVDCREKKGRGDG